MKPKLVVMAPYSTRSGYGAHSRDIISCLIKSDEFDITLIPINWGNTPMNALKEDNEMHRKMINLTFKSPISEPPDIFIQITIPNEFRPLGKTNIGITAGIETDRVSLDWIKNCNIFNCTIVPSHHAANTLKNTVYTVMQNNTVVNSISLIKPVEVLFEGVDTTVYKPVAVDDANIPLELQEIYQLTKDKFCFLSVGHWLQGEYRHDRKDVGGVVSNFLNAFNYNKDVALILKTSGATFSLLDREEILRRLDIIKHNIPDRDAHPPIYLLHGDLTDGEMNILYNFPQVKAMVSCTHGEGYGRPFAEFAAATGKPILATNWSGHTDFLNETDCEMFKYTLKPVDKSVVWNNIIIADSKWAYVDDIDVVNKMRRVFFKYSELLSGAKRCQNNILEHLTLDKMQVKLLEIIDKYKPATKSNLILPGTLDLSKLKKMAINK